MSKICLGGLCASGARSEFTRKQVPTAVTLVAQMLNLVDPGDASGLEVLLGEGNATSRPSDRAQQSVMLVRIQPGVRAMHTCVCGIALLGQAASFSPRAGRVLVHGLPKRVLVCVHKSW